MIFKSIKTKIVFFQLALVSLAVFLMWASSYFLIQHHLAFDQKKNLQHYADSKKKELEHFFNQIETSIERTAESREFKDFHITSKNLLLIELFTKFNQMFSTLTYVNKTGQEEVRVTNGKLSDRALINIGKNPTFQDSLRQRNKIVISPATYSDELSESVILFMLSKYAYFGDEFVGTLVGAIPISQFGARIEETIGVSGFASLIDSNGVILSYPKKDKILTKITGQGKEAEKLIADCKNLNAGLRRANILGIDGFIAYFPLKNAGWSVLVTIPQREFMEESNRLTALTALIFITILGLSTLVSLGLAKGITEPILKLVAGANTIAQGDFSKKVEVRAKDEIGQLTSAFNIMTQNLQKTTISRDELAEEVEERKSAQEELQTTNALLKQTQDQLLQSAKMASLGQLAGGIAHEINNPLTGVMNNVQILKLMIESGTMLDYKQLQEICGVIETSGLRCKSIIRSVLDFSHASKGSSQPLQLNIILSQTLGVVGKEMELDNITIQREYQPVLPDIQGDSQLLQQVVMGLLVNATWAINKRQDKAARVIILRTWSNPNEGMVHLSVSDNGIGIPQEHLSRIFEPFFTTKEVGEGTGLGLALIYKIIENHKATVKVESQVGVGTIFTIDFPIKR